MARPSRPRLRRLGAWLRRRGRTAAAWPVGIQIRGRDPSACFSRIGNRGKGAGSRLDRGGHHRGAGGRSPTSPGWGDADQVCSPSVRGMDEVERLLRLLALNDEESVERVLATERAAGCFRRSTGRWICSSGWERCLPWGLQRHRCGRPSSGRSCRGERGRDRGRARCGRSGRRSGPGRLGRSAPGRGPRIRPRRGRVTVDLLITQVG